MVIDGWRLGWFGKARDNVAPWELGRVERERSEIEQVDTPWFSMFVTLARGLTGTGW